MTVKREEREAALYAPEAAWAYLIIEVPAESSVSVKPFAVAIFGLSISIDQAPGEFVAGGVKVIVFWVRETVVAVGVAMIVTAPTAVAGAIRVEITMAVNSFLIMAQLSRDYLAAQGCDTYLAAESLMRFCPIAAPNKTMRAPTGSYQ